MTPCYCAADLAGTITCTVPADTKEVQVWAGGGDDTVTLETSIETGAFGEGGRDKIVGGAGPDTLYGDLDPSTTNPRTNVGTPGRRHARAATAAPTASWPAPATTSSRPGTPWPSRSTAARARTPATPTRPTRAPRARPSRSRRRPAPVVTEQPKPDVLAGSGHEGRRGPSGPKVAVPVPGKSVAATVKQGVILVRRPGTSKAVPLDPSVAGPRSARRSTPPRAR
jgi:hypothetical protein